jgi:hypothetical protein
MPTAQRAAALASAGALKAASKRAKTESAMDRVEVTGAAAVGAASALLGAVYADGTAAEIRVGVAEGRREVAAGHPVRAPLKIHSHRWYETPLRPRLRPQTPAGVHTRIAPIPGQDRRGRSRS